MIPRLGWSGADDAVLCHQCDFAGCVNPHHMRLGTNAVNRTEYYLRRRNLRRHTDKIKINATVVLLDFRGYVAAAAQASSKSR